MPAEGIPLLPKSHLMTADEIFGLAKLFVGLGVTKIRLTGGEPLVRKDFEAIVRKLSLLPVEIAITTNGILLDKYLSLFEELNITNITISLDSLDNAKNTAITRRNYFDKVKSNIELLKNQVSTVKINVVLLKNKNDTEIVDFIKLSQKENFIIRFIEFMPFDGNAWDNKQLVSKKYILNEVEKYFGKNRLCRLTDAPNDTARNYKITDFKGSFAIISSVTNPFCDTCNRIRLTADGQVKNCLFSTYETDILTPYRNGENIIPLLENSLKNKKETRGGMDNWEKLNDPKMHSQNRSMIAIGG